MIYDKFLDVFRFSLRLGAEIEGGSQHLPARSGDGKYRAPSGGGLRCQKHDFVDSRSEAVTVMASELRDPAKMFRQILHKGCSISYAEFSRIRPPVWWLFQKKTPGGASPLHGRRSSVLSSFLFEFPN